jgi:hypothetical protein
MDPSTLSLFAVVAVLAVNQLVLRVPALWGRDVVFYGWCVLVLGAGTWVMGVGLPGWSGLPVVSLVLGLFLFAHVAQATRLRTRWVRESRSSALAARESEMRSAVVSARNEE